ncbi:MAG: hypothetical protein K0S81_4118 [Rhodospirillales bacterium]|nr:hypothetical protein [Rhodospirillales bacterium]
MHVGERPGLGHGVDAVEIRVAGPVEQPVQRPQPALCSDLLRLHLLQAQDVGLEADQLGPEHGRAPLEAARIVARVVQTVQIEAGDVQARSEVEKGRLLL